MTGTACAKPAVLVVEDERIVAKDLQEELASIGYDAYAIATTAEEAVAAATARLPDLVLIDIRLAGVLDGIDTAHLLRARFGVALVYLTAHADEATLARAKLSAPYGYLLKPVRAAELRSTIEMALHKHALDRRQRAREDAVAKTLDAIRDAVIAVDRAGRVSLINETAARLAGIASDDAVGRPASEVALLVGPEPERLAIADSAHVAEVLVFRDPAPRRSLVRRLEATDRLAALGTLAAGVAHEVNNPLSVVVANAGYVSDELARMREEHGPDASVDEAIAAQGELLGAADRIARIVGDLREFTKPPQDGDARADVSAAIARAVRTTAGQLRERARVVTEVSPGLPAAAGDEARIAQVIVNLLVNAAQAIPAGDSKRHTVHVRARATGVAHERALDLEVADSGAGIPPELLGRVFEPFFTTKPVATGLGLAVCHSIVTSLGGEIAATSVVGEGTTIRVRLPLAAPPPAPTSLPHGARARVLVIDDEEPVLRALGRMLREHDVVTAHGGRAGLAAIERAADDRAFDVIFTDIGMPDMTGIELFQHLRATRPTDAERVVFVTGGAISSDILTFLESVPNDHVEKPVRGPVLDEVIARMLLAIPTSSSG